ncbi:DNA-directed RNA polymerase subunit omega [Clostridium tepidiprofundi DSM 19306]|uniref:DNA-directed RNA polymerase subunit omega n=1 Tax=Clostridium tepidiprofundi DSM 19306 TaxID=1121338 RepID=A0A151B803_9CLOT|nr:DNA-directed RNA polymerase subunit omega [Clostridium tepidiprofundi]KYH35920.1 DNA-directed RNA polymerase subunit omega [Clostridium tepidiprofundi DSM 19306]
MINSDAMINPSIVDLLKKVDNRYSLIIASSKRARQIIGGSDTFAHAPSNKPLTIAINEINMDALYLEDEKEGI